MTNDSELHDRAYEYFLEEVPELSQIIEQNLLTLTEEPTKPKIHEIMRATHTIKGGANTVGLEHIKSIAHSFEDVLRSLFHPKLKIDSELHKMLVEAYQCLQVSITAELTGAAIDRSKIEGKANSIFAQIQKKLGKYFNTNHRILTSEELGFDLVKSIFEVGVQQQLDEIASTIANSNQTELTTNLLANLEVLVELAESFQLLGFVEIAETAIVAVQVNPEQVLTIAKTVLEDLKRGQQQVIAGDRDQGGEPSPRLQQLAGMEVAPASESQNSLLETIWGDEESEDLTTLGGIAPSELEELEIEEPTKELDESEVDLLLSPVSFEAEIVSESQWEELEQESSELEEILSSTSSTTESDSETEVSTDDQSPTLFTGKPGKSVSSPSTVRVKLEGLKRLDYKVGELLINQNYKIAEDEKLQNVVKKLLYTNKQHRKTITRLRNSIEKILIATRQQQSEIKANSSLASQNLNPNSYPYYSFVTSNFDARQLTRYRELSQLSNKALEEIERLETTSKSIELIARNSEASEKKQQRLLDNIRNELIEARMLPLGEVFNRLIRTVQQLELTYHKSVNLKLLGKNVLVDKAIAEKLFAPLLHLVQNAFAHGIQSPEVRRQQGKSEKGKIEIRAYYQGGKTVIEVSDDGQGLDFDRIRSRAVNLNLYTVEQAEKLSEQQLSELLFEPGFSTASKVSAISGRGIGLEIVKSQMQELKGTCKLRSQPHKGTTFSLGIPLTLMIVKVMIVEAGAKTYTLLSDTVEKILRSDSSPLQFVEGQKVLISTAGDNESIVPVHNMTELINYNSLIRHNTNNFPEETPKNQKTSSLSSPTSTHLLLLRQGTKLLGLEVDRILGEQETLIRPLGKVISAPSYIYGCSVLNNSRLTLVIDGVSLITQTSAARASAQSSFPDNANLNPIANPPLHEGLSPSSSNPTLLIVDDSISQRKTLLSTLEKAGYKIIQAANGLEAIEAIQNRDLDIQLVICDLEMPALSGFEFLYHCRQKPELAQVPIVILTSRTGKENRIIAQGLGAQAYFNKPYLESELLSVIANLINKRVKTQNHSSTKFLPLSGF